MDEIIAEPPNNLDNKHLAMPNYYHFPKLTIYISEPLKWFGTFGLVLLGIAIYYSCTAKYQNVGLIALTAIFQVATIMIMVILALRNPGTI